MTNPTTSVLIVEDERIVATDLQQMLWELGYETTGMAASGDEAIARASERCPDVVLMDIRIKGTLDGIETAEVLRMKYDVPIVFLTAHADAATIGRAKRVEPYGYLVKPVRPAELRSAIEVARYKFEMDRRLRERERWFSTTVRSIADAVVTVNLAGEVTFMNPAAEALTGQTASSAEGRPFLDVVRLLDQDDAAKAPPLKALAESRVVELAEGRLLDLATGSVRLIADSAAPVVDQGSTLGAVMVFRDVTEQRKLETQVELSDRLASLGTMAAGVVHEVNSPLAVVSANVGFLAAELRSSVSSGMDPEADGSRLRRLIEAARDVESAVSRVGRILDDLRRFSRPPQSATGTANLAQCIDWAVRATAHEFRHRARLRTRLLAVPPVRADELRVEQVLVNLLVNAAHAIAPGAVDENQVTISTMVDVDGRAVIEVSDTGAGIPADVLERVFEPFVTTKATGLGTGLGLSICQGIVRSLGGEIQVMSPPGGGTTVRVTLPASPAAPAARAPASPTPVSTVRGRILVIEDEPLLLRAIGRLLGEHDVVCVENAKSGLALIESGEDFDVIVSDIATPLMTGIDLYDALLSGSPDLARRMIFLSGGALSPRVEDFMSSIPNKQLEKPFGAEELRVAVQDVLSSPR